jgi:hypothetical protein
LTESLFTGPEALLSLGRDARMEIYEIFPEICAMGHEPIPARIMPNVKQQRRLVAHHLKNNKTLFS